MKVIILCKKTVVLLLLFLFSFTITFAQSTVEGTVTDTTGLPMGDVSVTVKGTSKRRYYQQRRTFFHTGGKQCNPCL